MQGTQQARTKVDEGQAFSFSFFKIQREVQTQEFEMDEFKNYEKENLLPEKADICQYWLTKRYCYPHLYAMAKDFLAIPVSSASSERAFSQARNFISWNKSRLQASTIRQSMCLKNWIPEWNDIDNTEDIIKDIHDLDSVETVEVLEDEAD